MSKNQTIRERLEEARSIRLGETECLKAFDEGDLIPEDERKTFCVETGKWGVKGKCPIHETDRCLVVPKDIPFILNWIANNH